MILIVYPINIVTATLKKWDDFFHYYNRPQIKNNIHILYDFK